MNQNNGDVVKPKRFIYILWIRKCVQLVCIFITSPLFLWAAINAGCVQVIVISYCASKHLALKTCRIFIGKQLDCFSVRTSSHPDDFMMALLWHCTLITLLPASYIWIKCVIAFMCYVLKIRNESCVCLCDGISRNVLWFQSGIELGNMS